MIIKEFSTFLQQHNYELLTRKLTSLDLLPVWLSKIFQKIPENNIEKIIHKEILFIKKTNNKSIIIGKSESGRVLVNALIEFAKSYDHYTYAKWLNSTNYAYYAKI